MAYSGKIALVTGGASGQSLSRTSLHSTSAHSLNFPCAVGIGLGITTHLLKEGANVVIADLNSVAGAKVIDELNSTSP